MIKESLRGPALAFAARKDYNVPKGIPNEREEAVTMSCGAPIGVFDSGVGGISVLAQARRLLPRERFVYFGDTLHAPYGTRAPEEVLALAEAAFDRLRLLNCKAVVIACNTATAAAAAHLREKWPDLPIIAMEPALKPASLLRHGGSVLVLATPMTLRLEKFARLMALYGEGAVPVPCPGLPELVEAMDFGAAEAYLREKLAPHLDPAPDAVVLGCTHYVFLRPALGRILPAGTPVVDGNLGTARQLERVLGQRSLLRGEDGEGGVTLLSSSPDPEAVALMRRLLDAADDLCGVV